MSVRDAISGFYAVLDRDDEELARALVAEARVLQVRIKPRGGLLDAGELARIARMARRVCDDAGVALIVNNRIDIALAVDADGVHLGQTDLPLAEARRAVHSAGLRARAQRSSGLDDPRELWIGVSTHDLEQVRAAVAGGADYLGFGPVFATTTKQNPEPVQGLDSLRAVVAAAAGRPVVAIGGVTPDLAAEVYATGVHAICAISAINDAPNVREMARRMRTTPSR